MSFGFNSSSRHLAWDMCFNIRDLGGYPTRDGYQTKVGSILRGDNLCRLSRKGIQALLEYGVCTVIDLRSPSELLPIPHPFSVRNAPQGYPTYMNLPVLKEKNRDVMLALEKTRSSEESYPLILDRCKENIGAIMRAIAAAQPGGVMIHCHAGKDRTGLMAALILSLAGVAEDIIAADYAESDRYLQPMYQEILESGPEDPVERKRRYEAMLARPEVMLFTLAYLQGKYGSIKAYLRSAGVSDEEQAKIRGRILEK